MRGADLKYKRALLKLSGEALAGDQGFGISPAIVSQLTDEIVSLHQAGVTLGLVIGGGNIVRGTKASEEDLAEKALAAIAHHSATAVPAATESIVAIARDATDPDQRSHALFWLSQSDEPRAAKLIRDAIARDPDGDVREQGVLALHLRGLVVRVVQHEAIAIAEDVVADPGEYLEVPPREEGREHGLQQSLAGLQVLAGVWNAAGAGELLDRR